MTLFLVFYEVCSFLILSEYCLVWLYQGLSLVVLLPIWLLLSLLRYMICLSSTTLSFAKALSLALFSFYSLLGHSFSFCGGSHHQYADHSWIIFRTLVFFCQLLAGHLDFIYHHLKFSWPKPFISFPCKQLFLQTLLFLMRVLCVPSHLSL